MKNKNGQYWQFFRHAGENWHPGYALRAFWIPAFAGMAEMEFSLV